jgi:hypothetical protein
MDVRVIPIADQFRHLLELYPPVKANKILPEWYKKMSLSNTMEHLQADLHKVEGKNIMGAKNCPAIQDILTEGFIVPLWTKFDYATTVKDDTILNHYNLSFLDEHSMKDEHIDRHLSYHNPNQLGDMKLNLSVNKRLYKLMCPYYFILPEGYNIMYTDPFYHFRNDIRILSGIVQADKWGSITFPFEVYNHNFSIEAGTPFVHCFVYKRDEKVDNLIIDRGTEEEYDNIEKTFVKLFSSRKDYRKVL